MAVAMSPEDATRLLKELRLYALAVTPSAAFADQMIEAALRDLVEEKGGSGISPGRLRLFQAFQDRLRTTQPAEWQPPPADLAALLWRQAHIPRGQDVSSGAAAQAWLRWRLGRLSPAGRETLLLHHLCGFGVADVARILRQEHAAVAMCLARNWEDLELPRRAGVLIIEDELVVALDLSMLMRDLGHHVVGIAGNAMEAEALLQQGAPDLILADLQLGSAILEGERIIARMGREAVPVIYVTARPDRISRPSGGRPVFVVRKPFSIPQLSMAVYDALVAARERAECLG